MLQIEIELYWVSVSLLFQIKSGLVKREPRCHKFSGFFQWDDKTQMIVHLNSGLDNAKAEIMTRSIWNWVSVDDFVTTVNVCWRIHVPLPRL